MLTLCRVVVAPRCGYSGPGKCANRSPRRRADGALPRKRLGTGNEVDIGGTIRCSLFARQHVSTRSLAVALQSRVGHAAVCTTFQASLRAFHRSSLGSFNSVHAAFAFYGRPEPYEAWFVVEALAGVNPTSKTPALPMAATTTLSHNRPMERSATFCTRRRWLVISGWIVGAALLTLASGSLRKPFGGSDRLPGTDSEAAYDLLGRMSADSRAGHAVVPALVDNNASLVAIGPSWHKRTDVARIATAARQLTAVKDVLSVGTPRWSATRSMALIPLSALDNLGDPAKAAIHRIRSELTDGQPTWRTELGGDPFTDPGGPPATEAFGFVAAALILLITFRSGRAVGVPLFTALIGAAAGSAALRLLTIVVKIPDVTKTVALMIAIGVGIDYALFIVTRYRLERLSGADPIDAVRTAMRTAGHAVAFAGVTVVISVLGMLIARVGFMSGLALGTAAAVALTLAAALTLVPAVLSIGANRTRFQMTKVALRTASAEAAYRAPSAARTLNRASGVASAKAGRFEWTARHPAPPMTRPVREPDGTPIRRQAAQRWSELSSVAPRARRWRASQSC